MNETRTMWNSERLLEDLRWVRRLAGCLVGDDVADDVAQDAMVVALEADRRGTRDRASIRSRRAWMSGVVRHLAARVHRTRRMHEAHMDAKGRDAKSDDENPSVERIARLELQQRVVASVLALSDPYRDTVVLRFLEEHSVAEIAELHGVPEATVHTRLRRALAQLRERLDKEFGDNRAAWTAVAASLASSNGRAMSTSAAVGGAATLLGLATAKVELAIGTVVLAAATLAGLMILGGPESGEQPPAREREAIAAIANPAALPVFEEDDAPPAMAQSGDPALVGRVIDAVTGSGIANVRVTFEEAPSYSDPRPITSVVTDESGRYSIAVPVGESFVSRRLRIEHDAYVAERVGVETLPFHEEVDTVELVRGVEISGRVVDVDGNSVGGGPLGVSTGLEPQFDEPRESPRVTYRNRRPYRAASVSADGRFRVRVDGSMVALTVHPPGYAPAITAPFEPSESEELRLVVRRGHAITGVVRNPEGEPVAGARVEVRSWTEDRDPDRWYVRYPTRTYAVTNAAGAFQADGIASRLGLSVMHPDYASFSQWEAPYRAADPVVVELEPSAWLRGRLVDSDGKPIARRGGYLTIREGYEPYFETDDEGRFRTRALDPECAAGSLAIRGFEPAAIAWHAESGGHDVGEIALVAAASTRVTVTDREERPIAMARVELGRDRSHQADRFGRASTDALGVATLRALASEESVLQVSKPGFRSVRLEVPRGGLAPSYAIVLERSARLSGTIVDAEGAPVSGVTVDVLATTVEGTAHERSYRTPMATTYSNASGAFGAAASLENVTLRFTKQNFGRATVDVEDLVASESRGLDTVVMPRDGRVSGVVVRSSGEPATNVLLEFERRISTYEDEPWKRTVVSDDNGSFEVYGAPDGEIILTAWHDGRGVCRQEPIDVHDGESEPVRFELKDGTVYEGIVVDTDDRPIEGVRLSVASLTSTASGKSDADGRFEILAPPEPNLIVVNADGFRGLQIPIDGGASLPARIVIGGGAEIAVRFDRGDSEAELPRSVDLDLMAADGGHSFFSWNGDVKEGVARFRGIDPGPYRYTIGAKGIATETGAVDLREGQVFEVVLSCGTTPIVVRVTATDGSPVSAARLSIKRRYGNMAQTQSAGTTDADGLFELQDELGPGASLLVRATGFAPTEVEDAAERVEDGVLSVELAPAATLLVRVTDDSGRAIKGVQVSAGAIREVPGLFAHNDSATTDADGSVRIGDLSAGRVGVSFKKNQVMLDKLVVQVEAGRESIVDYRMPAFGPVELLVRRDGTPIDGGTIDLQNGDRHFSVTVDSEGRARTEIPYGSYDVRFRSPGVSIQRPGASSYQAGDVTASFGERELAGDAPVALDYTGHEFVVEVVDEDGKRLREGGVALFGVSGTEHVGNRFIEEGAARWTSLPAGTYRVHAMDSTRTAFAKPATVQIPQDRTVRVVVSEALRLPFEYQVDPLPRLMPYHVDERLLFVGYAARDRVEVLWPRGVNGTGVLEADGYAPVLFEVVDDTVTPTLIDFVPGGRLHPIHAGVVDVRDLYVRPAEAPVDPNSYWALKSFDTIRPSHLAPGDYVATVTYRDGRVVERPITIRDGETTEIDL